MLQDTALLSAHTFTIYLYAGQRHDGSTTPYTSPLRRDELYYEGNAATCSMKYANITASLLKS